MRDFFYQSRMGLNAEGYWSPDEIRWREKKNPLPKKTTPKGVEL
jgi:hypothetical protein